MRERPLSDVPRGVLALLGAGLLLQLTLHFSMRAPPLRAQDLPPAPTLRSLQLASFGEPIALSKMLMLYVQSYDAQMGAQQPYREFDYTRLQAWLQDALALDPRGQYPLFSASRIYADVADHAKQRVMLDFIYHQFLLDPNRRWPWLAEAAVLAKHRLKDLPLAQKYAQAIRLYATASNVPSWAKQMDIFLLEDMNELQSAEILLGGLVESGQITDPHELVFLQQRLDELKAKMATKK